MKLSVHEWSKLAGQGVCVPVETVLHGTSMEPLIRCKRDVVTIVPTDRALTAGQIILFARGDGHYVVHRLYRINEAEQMVQTWGDNCFRPDEPVPVSAVLGIAVSLRRNGKDTSLVTREQCDRGMKWLNSRLRRPLWLVYRRLKGFAGRIVYKRMPDTKGQA